MGEVAGQDGSVSHGKFTAYDLGHLCVQLLELPGDHHFIVGRGTEVLIGT